MSIKAAGVGITIFLIVAQLCVIASGKQGFGPGEQDWGYVEVRNGAKMFYWLYYTTASVKHYTERPLVIWLQGGPGASSTAYGNFEELGPLTLDLKERNHTWVKDVNVLFVDNPVGTGFSYTNDYSYLTKNNKQIAIDLVEFMRNFYERHSEFRVVPLHIFSESYGGKMAAEFALELYKAKKSQKIETNLVSVALGNSWISPMHSVNSWAPLLLNMGIVDHKGYNTIQNATKKIAAAIAKGAYKDATTLWGEAERVVLSVSENIDFYNILKPIQKRSNKKPSSPETTENLMIRTLLRYSEEEDNLKNLMRGAVSKALSIPNHIVWGSQNNLVFNQLEGDFMKPVIHIVEELLNKTDINVVVYSGQLDLICATPGTVEWIEKLHWPLKSQYDKISRVGFAVNGVIEGFVKQKGKFTMYWVNRGGHMVPDDNPAAMAYILKAVTKHG